MSTSKNSGESPPSNAARQPVFVAKPKTWPPADDFPISRDSSGQVVSRYGDFVWDMSDWAGIPTVLNFGDGPQRKDRLTISAGNARLLRQVAAWFLFGPRAVSAASTLKAKFKLVRPIFTGCSAHGILASDLRRYPAVVESIGEHLSPSRFDELVSVMHGLYEQRERLGFFILDRAGITRLVACAPAHTKRQTPYIPPRIWTYIIKRCKEFLDDYALHKKQIEECFRFCLAQYSSSIRQTRTHQSLGTKIPISEFAGICTRFGIRELLEKWTAPAVNCADDSKVSIDRLSSYLSMVGYVGTLYVCAFSLMRVSEAWKLRSKCFDKHSGSDFGDVYLIEGDTTKTQKEKGALWVAPKSVAVAVNAMKSVARLRMQAASENPDVPVTEEYLKNPYLVPRSYEPWSARRSIDSSVELRQSFVSLAALADMFEQLFAKQELTIRKEDLDAARRINPTLDNRKFAVGNVWTLSWHQFRRTGAVNMFASGIVSEHSLQYQLKHSTLMMTHFYAQGFSELALNEKTRGEILRTMYEMAAKDSVELFGDDFVSPHGVGRKGDALELIEDKELKDLRKLAKKGGIPWRETPFGGCTKAGPCEYGGFDHVIRCGGGDDSPPCAHGLFDRRKQPAVLKLSKRISLQLADIPDKSPLRSWMNETLIALTNIILAMDKEPDHEQG